MKFLNIARMVLVASFCATASVFAQQELGEARVVSVREEVFSQRLDSVQISRQGLSALSDVLRHFTGVNLRDYGGAGGLKTVSVQGLGASHTALTINGIAVDNGRSGQVDFSRYALEDVTGMTLSVGVSDSLLKPVRSLAAVMVEMEMKPTSNRVYLTKSSWGGWETGGRANFNLRQSKIGFSGRFMHAGNDYPYTLDNGAEKLHERRSHSQVNQGDLNVSFNWKNVDFQAFYSRSDRHLPGPVTYYTFKGTEQLDEQSALAQIRYKNDFSHGWTAFVAAKFQFQEQRYRNFDAQYPNGLQDHHYWQREYYGTFGFQKSWSKTKLSFATDITRNSLTHNLTTLNPHRTTFQSALSFQTRFGAFSVTARALGHYVRNAASSDFQRLTSEAALKWSPRGVGVFGIYYKSNFRAPSFAESYYYHLGSPDLKPELTRQAGVVADFRTGPSQWGATAYYNRVSDRITGIPYNLFVWRMVNLGRVDNWGVEVRHHTPFFVRKSRFDIYANYAFLHNVESESRHQLAYTPRHSGSFAFCWSLGLWRAALNGTVAGERWATLEHTDGTRLKAYSEWNLSGARTFEMKWGKMELSLNLKNVFNTRYEIVRRYPMPGFNYGLTIKCYGL